MQLEDRINAFSKLGSYIRELATEKESVPAIIERAKQHNGWFTLNNIYFALNSWGNLLKEEHLVKWTQSYDLSIAHPKWIGVVMAGNIPLVGFHDFVSVLISGHKIKAKLSSNDSILLPHLAEKLIAIEPAFQEHIQFSKNKLTDFDAVIATGSNNTARHFEHYFGKYPNIIRKNRNGIAVLTGKETENDLMALANDIFRYFGLGCRNVSKLFIPKVYDFDPFFNAMYSWKELINNDKYINNYDYNKAVYLMSNLPLLDNEFMLLKEDSYHASPISVVFYEYYNDLKQLQQRLKEDHQSIQCIVGNAGIKDEIPFGTAQTPSLSQYADGVDTLSFLIDL